MASRASCVFAKDFSASRVARLSRRAMELPYVHGVRFEACNFAWVAHMRGEVRRFLVKKHGFEKSRLCAVEKIEHWRATLPEEALRQELKGTWPSSEQTFASLSRGSGSQSRWRGAVCLCVSQPSKKCWQWHLPHWRRCINKSSSAQRVRSRRSRSRCCGEWGDFAILREIQQRF